VAEVGSWAQLTYSSFDRDQGSGGWQVKDLTGSPSDDETRLLQKSVVTGFDYHGDVSTYPSTEEITGWPRRFSFVRTPLGGRYVHAVQAGRDSTGRPGNTYSHVSLDRRMSGPAEADYLPIDLWKSRAFETPYGVEQILKTEVHGTPEQALGEFAGTPTALSIMSMPGYREPLMAAIDAVEQVQHGHGMLVLVTDRQDWAALLISAMSRLTSPGAARSLSFSLYERARALPAAKNEGITVAAVPSADLDSIDPATATFVLVDGEIPESSAENHVVAHGAPIPRTDFSRMVESIQAADPALLTEVVEGLSGSGIDGELSPADVNSLDIAWPLAMLIRHSTQTPFPAEAAAAAERVILRSSPISVGRSATFLPAVREVIAGAVAGVNTGHSGGVAEAGPIWAALLERGQSDSALATALLEHAYLLAAISDEKWLDSGSAPVGDGAWWNLDDGGELRTAVQDALKAALRSCESAEYRPDFEFKLLSFLARASLIGDPDRQQDPEAEQLVDAILGSNAVRTFANSSDIPELTDVFDVSIRERLLWHISQWDMPGCSTEFLFRIAQSSPRSSWPKYTQAPAEGFSNLEVRLMLELVRVQGTEPGGEGPAVDAALLENAVRAAAQVHPGWNSLDSQLRMVIGDSRLSLPTLQYLEDHYPQWLSDDRSIAKVLATEPYTPALQKYLERLLQTRREAIPLVNLRMAARSNGTTGTLRTSSTIVDELHLISSLELSDAVKAELAPVAWCAALDFAAHYGLNEYANLAVPVLPDFSRFPVTGIEAILARAEFLWAQGNAVKTSIPGLAMSALLAADQEKRMSQSANPGRKRPTYSLGEQAWPFSEEILWILNRETPADERLITAILNRLSETVQGGFLKERISENNRWFYEVKRSYRGIARWHRQTEDEIDETADAFEGAAEKWRKSIGKFKLRDQESGKKTFPFVPGRGRPNDAIKAEGER
jgi:hypothetical protein